MNLHTRKLVYNIQYFSLFRSSNSGIQKFSISESLFTGKKPKNQKSMHPNDANAPTTPDRARYTMVGFFTDKVAKVESRGKQTFRGDYTRNQYGSKGMAVQDMHDLYLLYKKYLELHFKFKQVMFYDNYLKIPEGGTTAHQVVYKLIIKEGKEHVFGNDLRAEYYDLDTGKPHAHSLVNGLKNLNL